MDLSGLTQSQKNILEVISDGESHHFEEVRAVLYDDQVLRSTIRSHIVHIRKALRPKGYGIVTEIREGRQTYYRLVRLVASATDGRK